MLSVWIDNLLNNIKDSGDGKDGADVLEQCGRTCAKNSVMRNIKPFKERIGKNKEDKEILEMLNSVWGKIHIEDGNIFVIYDECYCPVLKEIELKNSFFCNCSRGWIKEVFETVFERPAEVELQKSIISGNDKCKFKINLGAGNE